MTRLSPEISMPSPDDASPGSPARPPVAPLPTLPGPDALPAEVTIPRRCRGPVHSANGGYASGVLAAPLGAAATATLRSPPPLDRPLLLTQGPEGGVALMDGETLVGEARPGAPWLDDHPEDTPPPVPLPDAAAASERTPWTVDGHPLPECFVCGPARAEGDGLRVLSGKAAPGERPLLAALWTPGEAFADSEGLLRAEAIWSALDCPSGQAASMADAELTRAPMLLGRMAARIEARPPAGAPLVVASRMVMREGRKITAASALYDGEGRRLANARTLWITVPAEKLYAALD